MSRHCTCVFYNDWHRTKRPKLANKDGLLPAVSRAISYQPPIADGAPASSFSSPRNTLVSGSGIVVALNDDMGEQDRPPPLSSASQPLSLSAQGALPFDEEAKLVYGVILSLRTMMKKLSKRCVGRITVIFILPWLADLVLFHRDENFTSYRTSTYKMHLYETPTLYKFVVLTDPKAESPAVRFSLRQIYAGPFLEYVVRNPLVQMDSRERGIDNDYFRASVDRLIKGQVFYN